MFFPKIPNILETKKSAFFAVTSQKKLKKCTKFSINCRKKGKGDSMVVEEKLCAGYVKRFKLS